MADGVKISLLPGAGTPSDTDVVAGVQNGSTKKFSFAAIFAWLKAKLTPGEIGAQEEITASGILMGDGHGGVTTAQAGTDYATPDQIPLVPSASTANPQMDGAASPGSTGQWADGGHVHPTDTSRAPADLEINGHPLTGDFDLTAADVGALASGGTAVAAGKLAQAHSITASSTGWYKVFELTLSTYSNTRNILLLASNSYIRPLNFINLFFQKTSSADMSMRCDIPSITTYGAAFTRFKYTLSGNTGALWWHKTNANDRLVLRVLSAINGDGTEADISSCWQNTYSASEPSGALEPWSNNNIKFENVPVNAGTNQEILRITSNRIVANMEPIRIEFANSDQITSTLTWNIDVGVFTLTGTCTSATTANVLLGWNAV